MKAFKKTLVLALVGVMAVAALALTGCFSVNGGGGAPGNEGGSTTKSELAGTWKLSAAYDCYGDEYDVSAIGADSIKLVVASDTKGTFYYFDDDPFTGTLSRESSLDSYYAVGDFDTKAYYLTGLDDSYWEFALITASNGEQFIYLEIGPEGEADSIYLEK